MWVRLVFTSDEVGVGVRVVIRSVELYDLVKTAFWSRLGRLRSSENWVVVVTSRSKGSKQITKRGNVHCDRFVLPLLLPTPTIWFSLDRKRRSHKRNRKKLRLRLRRVYDSANLRLRCWFSPGHRRSYDSAYDSNSNSVASENQPLVIITQTDRISWRDSRGAHAYPSFLHSKTFALQIDTSRH